MSKIQVAHSSRLANLIDYKLRVLTQDGRVYIGQLMAFDKHMNLVLNECIEERVPKTQLDKLRPRKDSKDGTTLNIKVEKRVLGLTILRGEQILSTVVEDKPLLSKKERLVRDKKEKKQAQKQTKLRKEKEKKPGKIAKPNTANVKHTSSNSREIAQPSSSRYNGGNDNIGANRSRFNNEAPPQTRKFQPPPGFKRK
ncbi:BAH_G0014460.mRNA.1.CDS.1 [Saccharomyces cerevisiae]|nr:SMB1 [Saccharomyces cerevisiae]CAD6623924.1 SX2_G0001030.mRNA.1.CDS.1 [Saccharomyces cerevisiae]CAI4407709.1 BCN_G0015150.mRNA.1.CDS.1 [Saccharomyces cerevisiae]CAI4409023.1 CPI_1c_G0014810.mRNA.1.CDS.1 [Saccharomyces cerevisiae]CAI4421647.1 BCE_3a_G0014970.mRNA.1.CDS.1 [Saccharomyces cerevisiae]